MGLTDKEMQTLCECCWKPIIGEQYTIDELTMCEDCLIYHYGGE
jgi:hypothetical protein